MKGEMAIFRIIPLTLSAFITVDFSDYCSDTGVYAGIVHYLLAAVYEQNIRSGPIEKVLLLPVTLPDPAFEKIAFYGPSEMFFRDGYHDPVESGTGAFPVAEPQLSGSVAECPVCKKVGNVFPAAEPFFFRKGMDRSIHPESAVLFEVELDRPCYGRGFNGRRGDCNIQSRLFHCLDYGLSV